MHKRAAAVVAGGLIATTTIAAAAPAGAYQTWNDHRLKYGIVGQQYWISPSADGHTSGITTAFGNWNGTSTAASWSKTTVQGNSHIDLYKVSTINNWWGIANHFIDTTQLPVPPNQNWWWVKIRLDGDWSNCPNKVGVIAHEIGHAMGLAHVTGGNPRLMRADIPGLSTTAPYPDDVNGINHLYG